MSGTKAPQAAAVIHNDFERGFIACETIAYDDFVASRARRAPRRPARCGWKARSTSCRDGDVLLFRFNVVTAWPRLTVARAGARRLSAGYANPVPRVCAGSQEPSRLTPARWNSRSAAASVRARPAEVHAQQLAMPLHHPPGHHDGVDVADMGVAHHRTDRVVDREHVQRGGIQHHQIGLLARRQRAGPRRSSPQARAPCNVANSRMSRLVTGSGPPSGAAPAPVR